MQKFDFNMEVLKSTKIHLKLCKILHKHYLHKNDDIWHYWVFKVTNY